MRYLILNEASNVDDEYTRNYSSIDREVFDNIVLADPRTRIVDGAPKGIGFGAKSLLLPAYKAGEVDWYDNLEEVSKALQTFYTNQNSYDPQFRNLNNFKSVADFLQFVSDPENFSPDNFGAEEAGKSPLDDVYDKYYSSINREIFNSIIEADPKTDGGRLGPIVKNLVLPRYLSGEKGIEDSLEDLKDAIKNFYIEKDSLPVEKQKIEGYKTVEEFIDYMLSGPESDLITKLKNSSEVRSNEWELITSDFNYDVVLVKTANVNFQITHDFNGNGTQYINWCTGYNPNTSYFTQYNRHSDLYDFLYKKDLRDRTMNYQLALRRDDHTVHQFLDGKDEADGIFNAPPVESEKTFRAFLYRNPTLVSKLIKLPGFKDCPSVREVYNNQQVLKKPFIYDGQKSLEDFRRRDLGKFVRELTIKDVEVIPPEAFYGCLSLEKVTLSEGLKKIGDQAFMYCKSLTDIVLPESLEEIGSEAFAEDVSLRKNLKLPNNLIKIGREAFRGTFCKVTIDRKRTKVLKIDPADKEWFLMRHKAIKVQEDLNESILDENIPPDLARAYNRSVTSNSGSRLNPRTRHVEVGTNGYRRGVTYDYANSNYEEITKEEAKRIGRKEKDKINQLRFIVGGNLVEFESRDGRLHQVYWTDIPWEILDEKGVTLTDKSGRTTNDSKFAKYDVLVDLADKIYKTDEYEHEITPETPTKQIVGRRDKIDPSTGEVMVDDDGRTITEPVYSTISDRRSRSRAKSIGTYTPKDSMDYMQHNLPQNYSSRIRRYNSSPDTGSHRRYIFGLAGNFEAYESKLRFCDDQYRYWSNLVRQLKKLNSDRELYSEEEFNTEVENLNREIEQARENYNNARKELRQIKDKMLIFVDDETKQAHDRILSALKEIQEKLDRLYSIKGKLAELRLSRASSSGNPQMVSIKSRIDGYREQADSLFKSMDEIKTQIEDLRKKLDELTESLKQKDVDLVAAISQIEELTSELTELTTLVSKEKFAQIDNLERERVALEQELGRISRRNTQNIERHVDVNIEDVIDFSEDEDDTSGDDTEDTD